MNNKILALIIVLLLTFIYFFEEKKIQGEFNEREKREELFSAKDLGELASMSGSDFEIFRKNEVFKSRDDFFVSPEQVEFFLRQTQNIKIQRILSAQEVLHIPKDVISSLRFNFESGDLEISIGEKINFDTTFYLKVTNLQEKSTRWAIAKYDSGYAEQLSFSNSDQAHRSRGPYDQVLSLFSLDNEFFYELKIFNNIKIDNVEINSFRNPTFTINLEDKTTLPAALKGVKYDVENFDNYKSLLQEFKAKKVYQKSFDLEEEIATIKFGQDTVNFYKKFGGKNGYFILFSNFVYEIDGSQFRELVVPLQHFWNKKIELIGNESFKIYELKDNQKLSILETNLNISSFWSKTLKSEAHLVREHTSHNFEGRYVIDVDNKSTYLVREELGGIEILDQKKNLIYHFLVKIK